MFIQDAAAWNLQEHMGIYLVSENVLKNNKDPQLTWKGNGLPMRFDFSNSL